MGSGGAGSKELHAFIWFPLDIKAYRKKINAIFFIFYFLFHGLYPTAHT
jgi:hypothetical protein